MSWLLLTLSFLSSAPVDPTQIDYVKLNALPLNERMVETSGYFLNTSYRVSPLGEGSGAIEDADPLIRFDSVDCQTFVETAMALALSVDSTQTLPLLSSIRYQQGNAQYGARNHITEAQWVPNNLRQGFVTDVTRLYGKSHTQVVKKTFSPALFEKGEGKLLHLAPESQPSGTVEWLVIPPKHALQILRQVPAGTIVIVVRADLPNRVTRVSHLGLLIHGKAGEPMLRHASKSFRKVVDEPFERYLKRNLDFAPWTISGLSLMQLNNPAVKAVGP